MDLLVEVVMVMAMVAELTLVEAKLHPSIALSVIEPTTMLIIAL
ncbi:hypothetical protein A2U01_0078976, partial [Trifolium medium]|nr:hypothetical protein [Trifolium medium]